MNECFMSSIQECSSRWNTVILALVWSNMTLKLSLMNKNMVNTNAVDKICWRNVLTVLHMVHVNKRWACTVNYKICSSLLSTYILLSGQFCAGLLLSIRLYVHNSSSKESCQKPEQAARCVIEPYIWPKWGTCIRIFLTTGIACTHVLITPTPKVYWNVKEAQVHVHSRCTSFIRYMTPKWSPHETDFHFVSSTHIWCAYCYMYTCTYVCIQLLYRFVNTVDTG